MTFMGMRIAVAIPDTVLEERDSPRDKTAKLGSIARTCSIFGVDVIEVFGDKGGAGEAARIEKVLGYIETPQYLRKRIYPIDDDLRFAGMLPPLRTPSHRSKVPIEKLKVGEFREGVTNADGTIDVGLDDSPVLSRRTPGNRRVTVRVTSKNPLMAEVVSRESVGGYWGYVVKTKTLEEMLTDRGASVKIATSRLGDTVQAVLPGVGSALRQARSVKFIFGAPSRGLFDIVGSSLPEKVDFVVNLFAEQHVETVRTEEAIAAALNLLNFLSPQMKA